MDAARCVQLFLIVRPTLAAAIRMEKAVFWRLAQAHRCDAQTMVAIRRNLMLARADRPDRVDPHQSSNAALANIEPHLLQLHPRATIAAKAQTVLLPDMGQHFHRSRAPGLIAALTDIFAAGSACDKWPSNCVLGIYEDARP